MALIEPTIRRKIELMHRARAVLIARTSVEQWPDAQTPHEEVLVFELSGDLGRRYCFAWLADGRVATALDVPPVQWVVDAVRPLLPDDGAATSESGPTSDTRRSPQPPHRIKGRTTPARAPEPARAVRAAAPSRSDQDYA